MGRDTFCISRGSATEQKPKSSRAHFPPGFHLPGNQPPKLRHVGHESITDHLLQKVDPPLGMLCWRPITTAVDSPGTNPDYRDATAVSSRWTMSPMLSEWTAGESNPHYLGANRVSRR